MGTNSLNIPPPPPGFVVDENTPPEGFVLDGSASPPLSVADKARASLKAKGLTPEDVKSGAKSNEPYWQNKATTFPWQIEEAPSKQSSNQTFGAGLKQSLSWLLHPLDTIDSSLDGAAQFTVMGDRPPELRDVPVAGQVIGLPSAIKDTAKESYRRGEAHESRADLYGNVTGMAAQALAGKLAEARLPKNIKPPVEAPEPTFSVDPAGPSYAPDVLGDNVNKALGTGFDINTGKNAGKAAALFTNEIDPKLIAKDPTIFLKHSRAEMDVANLAADQLLSSPEATKPSVSGIKILEQATGRKPLLSPAEEKQWNNIVDHIKNDLEAKSQLNGSGLNSIKDIDSVKRLVQDRTNFDRLFSASDTVRNELLGRLGRAFDKVGDTLPNYRELNDLRSNIIHYEEQIKPIIQKAKNGIAAPSKVKAIAKGAKALVTGKGSGLVQAGLELSESGMTPVKIAKEINKAIAQGRTQGLTNPAVKILSSVDKSLPFLQHDVHEFSMPPQFAAGESGEALPLGKFRVDDVAASKLAPVDFDPEAAMLHSSLFESEAQPSSFSMSPQFGSNTTGGAMEIGARGIEDLQASFGPHGPGVLDDFNIPPIREMIERQTKASNPIGKIHSQLAEPPNVTQSPIEAASKARVKSPALITEKDAWIKASNNSAVRLPNGEIRTGPNHKAILSTFETPNKAKLRTQGVSPDNMGWMIDGKFISLSDIESTRGSLSEAFNKKSGALSPKEIEASTEKHKEASSRALEEFTFPTKASTPPVEGLPPFKPRSAFSTDAEFLNYQLERQKAILASYK